MVIEHYKEIFGNDTLFFDPQIMTNNIGVTAKSDGLILALDRKQWFILEIELAQHSLSDHIIPQITRFNVALQQPETKAKLIESLTDHIKEDPYKIASVQKNKIQDISEYLKETIQKLPLIAIIIDEKTPDLEPICNSLPFKTVITEFNTFTRENAFNVHIHSFSPLWESEIPKVLSNMLAVFQLVYKGGKTYDEAIKGASKKLKLNENTLRAACSRDIGITSEQLRKIMVNSDKIKQLLITKFPEYEVKIQEAF